MQEVTFVLNTEEREDLFAVNRLTRRMAGGAHIVMRLLLLLSSLRAGVIGDDCVICSERRYDIAHPCGEDVCFHVWHFSTTVASDYVAIVSNGGIQTSKSPDDDSECTLAIEDLTAEDVGRHSCHQGPGALSPHNSFPVINVRPGKALALQCLLLTSVEKRHCFTTSNRRIRLTWVDETDAEIQEDPQHQIKRQSPCDVTLTVTLPSPQSKRLRCRVKVGRQIQTSEELLVKFPVQRGRRGGRRGVSEQEEGNQGAVGAAGAAGGVVGCVALVALLVAAVVMNRRRAAVLDTQPPNEPLNTTSEDNVNADDVIYADIILPTGRQVAWVQDCESTEYACIRVQKL